MRAALLAAVAAGAVLAACAESTPVAPVRSALRSEAGIANIGSGTQKYAITGTLNLYGIDFPPTFDMTPSGNCHFVGILEHTTYAGDVTGDVTYVANAKTDCASTHLRSSGSFGGRVTYQGRTGDISGQWETNCKFDPATGNLSCGGVSNARGSGGLDGVQFHIEWGPGWWPFTYVGTAFVQ